MSLNKTLDRLFALKESDTEALARLTIYQHEHLRPIEAGWRLARFDLGTNHFDRVVDIGGVAFEGRHACVHVSSFYRKTWVVTGSTPPAPTPQVSRRHA